MLTQRQLEIVQTALAEVNATAITLCKQRDLLITIRSPVSDHAVKMLDQAIDQVRMSRLAIARVR